MKITHPILLFGCTSQVGKDTLCSLVNSRKELRTYAKKIVGPIRVDLDTAIRARFGISVWTEDPKEKEIIRPIMVAWGEAAKAALGREVWVRDMIDLIRSEENPKFDGEPVVHLIGDWRFDFEAQILREAFPGRVLAIIVEREGKGPANATEAENMVGCYAEADFVIGAADGDIEGLYRRFEELEIL